MLKRKYMANIATCDGFALPRKFASIQRRFDTAQNTKPDFRRQLTRALPESDNAVASTDTAVNSVIVYVEAAVSPEAAGSQGECASSGSNRKRM